MAWPLHTISNLLSRSTFLPAATPLSLPEKTIRRVSVWRKFTTSSSAVFLRLGEWRIPPWQSCRGICAETPVLRTFGHAVYYWSLNFRGRTGFDLKFEAQAACRGWFVGLVKNRAKTNKRRSRRSRSRGLIDRDVSAATPASGGNVDSRLANRRSDRAGV